MLDFELVLLGRCIIPSKLDGKTILKEKKVDSDEKEGRG